MITKTILGLIGLATILSTNAQEKKSLQLSGTTPQIKSEKVYLQQFKDKIFKTIDSSSIEDSKFQFKTKLKLPELYGLSVDTTKTPLYIFLDNSKTIVDLDSTKFYSKSAVIGSQLQTQFQEYKEHSKEPISDYIKSNPSSLVTAYILYRNYAYRLTPEEINTNIELLDGSLKNSQYVQLLHNYVGILDKVSIGKKAPDFTSLSPDGKSINLANNLTKYTLVDFWASWCGPCRRENPNVVAAYQKYKAKGFSVFGVSLDKSKDNWIAAIKNDHLDWLQVSELKYWGSEIAHDYGVRAIPSNFLLDENGIIVGKNLRGEDLNNKLAELLQ
ncbi:TlpA disulfide reductase family protein [Rhizosphaericola mali]|uniref:AhpC/TSA family protein n=1 Tax=Rhizosphaericola mali TaxID=2545455 RepID=A0A5P2G3A8_9BACT|nr:TlpA disulfide reductase family protein [Rhizosphaericola mali]QES88302.1 AhpC/TSA family protein [Rhizosphaericola mali]